MAVIILESVELIRQDGKKREEISEENFKFTRVGVTDLFLYRYRREVTNIYVILNIHST